MKSLFWQVTGNGYRDLVLLHGWGLNAEIWSYIVPYLAPYFRLHMVDLPGYGRSYGYGALNLEEMAEEIISRAPIGAFWLGWSLGGLVATKIACQYPNEVKGLITVASSPRFCAGFNWPGIKPAILEGFIHELNHDFTRTINRFLNSQALGALSVHQDIHHLKSAILSYPIPSTEVLISGLMLLCKNDIRAALGCLNIPVLRLYGHLDNIVPRTVVPLVDKLNPTSKSFIFKSAAHAPFISNPSLFCKVLCEFVEIRS